MSSTTSVPSAVRLGIDLGGSKIEIAAFAPDGTERARRRIATPQGDYAATIAAVAALVAGVESELGLDPGAATVGIGTPGSRSRATGLLRGCNSVCLNGKPFGDDLAAALRRPVAMSNDANCFALSEATDGAGAGARVVFGVILGTGVGGGIVVDGRVLDGPNGIAGEWGHNPLPWPRDDERPGPACFCGHTGCIETFLSGPGLERDHARTVVNARTAPAAGDAPATAIAIGAAAADGDFDAQRTLARYEERLARALAHVINVLDPDVIVLGGGLSNLGRLYANVPTLWGQWVFSDCVDTRLVPNLHGDSSGVRGAAWLPAGAR
jgi:fructokinase